MPSTRDIRRRIKSVKSTAQITKAMQMVAASKMRKAQQAALAGRPYATLLARMLTEAVRHAGGFSGAFMEKREVRKRAVILITSDKGLCGALNSNLLREAARLDQATTVFLTAGRKGSQFIGRTRRNLAAEFAYKDTPQFSDARAVIKMAAEMFEKHEVDQVDVMYNHFHNTLTQRAELRTLLPAGEILGKIKELQNVEDLKEELGEGTAEFHFEPSASRVFQALVPQYLMHELYQFMLEAKASEHSARMVAMKNATDNAGQLIKQLTLQYNKMRQTGITTELLEISSATAALG